MQRRMQDLDANHAPKIVVLDEFPSITANIESATDIVTTLIREAREAKIRLFILSQGRQVKTLKLEGQSDLRENLTDILLGQFASDRAKELVGRKQAQPALIDWCRGQSRPILVADEPALLSQIIYPCFCSLVSHRAGSYAWHHYHTRTGFINRRNLE